VGIKPVEEYNRVYAVMKSGPKSREEAPRRNRQKHEAMAWREAFNAPSIKARRKPCFFIVRTAGLRQRPS
jgi:hypothetical protein